jgi:hypothetical protein
MVCLAVVDGRNAELVRAPFSSWWHLALQRLRVSLNAPSLPKNSRIHPLAI